jgi:hypothetical protein
MSRADTFEAEELMLKTVSMSYMGLSYEVKLSIVSICLIGVKDGKVMYIIGPRSHKASKADRFRGKMWKIIKGMSRDNVGELRHNSRGR